MNCELTNSNCVAINIPPTFVGVGNNLIEVKTSGQQHAKTATPIFSVELCARIELSLVPEVERVFIDREGDGEFRVISVVNKRDAEVRDRVYDREEAIMQAYPGLNFDFHVIARMGRKLEDVITKAGKLTFER